MVFTTDWYDSKANLVWGVSTIEVCKRRFTGLVQSDLCLEFGFLVRLLLFLLFIQLYLLKSTLVALVGCIFLPANTTVVMFYFVRRPIFFKLLLFTAANNGKQHSRCRNVNV